MKFNDEIKRKLKESAVVSRAFCSEYVTFEAFISCLLSTEDFMGTLYSGNFPTKFPSLVLEQLQKYAVDPETPYKAASASDMLDIKGEGLDIEGIKIEDIRFTLAMRRLLEKAEEIAKARALKEGEPGDDAVSGKDIAKALMKLLVSSGDPFYNAWMEKLQSRDSENSKNKDSSDFSSLRDSLNNAALQCFSVLIDSVRGSGDSDKDHQGGIPRFMPFSGGSMRISLSSSDDDEEGVKGGRNSLLERFGSNLVEDAVKHSFDPLVGRVEELERLIQVLMRRRKNNPILIGEAGVGKTAIVQELARLIAIGEVPAFLRSVTIFSLDVAALLAGTKYRGEFEERMVSVIQELLEHPNYILFIDEIHRIWGAGSTIERTGDLSNILKPYLSSGRIRCIGATTYEDYRVTIEKDKALSRRLQKIDISEPTVEQTIKILRGLKVHYEKFHDVVFTDEAIEAAVRLSNRHISNPPNPDKSIDVIDEAGSCYRAYKEQYSSNVIDETEIKRVVSKIARIPNIDLFADEKEKLKNLESDLKAVVFGQDEAILSVVQAVKLGRAGLKRSDRPIASFLFAGPTGVGKTELAKQLATSLNVEFLRFDMSEYSEKQSISRLVGSDPGYVGYDQGGQLTNAVIKHPHSIVLFDEIEKAHPNIYNVFLQIMDAARLTDNMGREANFRNVIIIMTSNVGARGYDQGRVGFERDANPQAWDSRELKKTFSPEFRNRLDKVVNFRPLPKEIVIQIVEKFIKETEFQLAEQKVTFQLTDEVKTFFAEKGYDPKLGARPLDRLIQTELKASLADEILFGRLANGGNVLVSLQDGKIELEIEPRAPEPDVSAEEE